KENNDLPKFENGITADFSA
ncbi:unnamed protein product, partial [Rotaria sordida]